MNPSNNAGMELPPPVGDQIASPELPLEDHPISPEIRAAQPIEKQPGINAGFQSLPPIPISDPPLPSQPPTDDLSSDNDDPKPSPSLLRDKELIEKEWVNKAKAIVEKNREDPYKQSEDLTLLKADYMKKYFNKTLKVSK